MTHEGSAQDYFRRVYEDVYPIAVRIAYRITSDIEVAEELCHEAFIKFLDKMDAIPDAQQAKYWIIRVVKNLSLNNQKRLGREAVANRRAYFEPSAVSSETGETSYLKREAQSHVQQALATLPDNLRVVLVMKEYGDLSYKEIGSVLGISETNVKVRAHRAREKLAEYLDGGDVYVP